MWKVYLRQIVRLLRENKFFSVVYILGTALSVAMIMLILITYHIKSGDIGVEDRRSRTAYVIRGYAVPEGETHWSTSSFLSPEVVEKWFYPVKSAEAVSILVKGNSLLYSDSEQRYEQISATYTDAAFWRIFSMRFLEGHGFSEADVKGKVTRVVIDRTTARRLFGTTDVVGRPLRIDWQEYRVCGVVDDVPTYFSDASSHIYLPYTTNDYAQSKGRTGNVKLGMANCLFLLRSPSDLPALKQELEHQVQLINGAGRKYRFSIGDQPYGVSERMVKMLRGMDADKKVVERTMRLTLVILVLFLLVPAINLSGLIVARMKKRAEELGVRKAFGASTSSLMMQMFVENFVQMLIGGVLGLLMAYCLFRAVGSVMLPDINSMIIGASAEGYSSIRFWHVIDLTTVGYVLAVTFLLNLVSTLLPAWRYCRVPVVDALNKR